MFALSRVPRRLEGLLIILGIAALLGFVLILPNPVNAQTAPTLGTAVSVAVLGSSTVTNTGPTVVNGDVGVTPGHSITGFPPGVVTPPHRIISQDTIALQAQNDATTAFNALGGEPCNVDLTGQDLGGMTLTAGVYCFNSSAQLTGLLTLDAASNADAVFIFKTGSTVTTASASSILVINGGSDCNVWWQVGSSATLGTTTSFVGNILAYASITLTTGANLSGRAFALRGAVTMDTNTIGTSACIPPPAPTAVPPAATAFPTSVPTSVPISAPTSAPTAISVPGGVSGLPDTGGGPPQATYWITEPGQ